MAKQNKPAATTEQKPDVMETSVGRVIENSLNIGVATVEFISRKGEPVVNTSFVEVLIEYPKDYKGKKHLVNGKTYKVSSEVADGFVSEGIATIVNDQTK